MMPIQPSVAVLHSEQSGDQVHTGCNKTSMEGQLLLDLQTFHSCSPSSVTFLNAFIHLACSHYHGSGMDLVFW